MTNHFIFSYLGNKRNEFKYMENIIINYDDYDTIIEPFCGSSSISYNIWLKHPNKKFILNDNNDDLMNVYNLIKNEDPETIRNKILDIKNTINNDKEIFNQMYNDFKKDKNNDIYKYIYFNKFYCMRQGCFRKSSFNDFTKEQYNFFKFIKTANITLTNNDWSDVFNKYSNDDKAIFFIDPPYILSCNIFYKNFNTNLYEYFVDKDIDNFKAKLIFILENNWIVKFLFKNKQSFVYNKKYEISQNKTEHIIIYN